MHVAISAGVSQARLKDAARKASELFLKVIPKAVHSQVRLSFEILVDEYSGKWILVTLEYDGSVTERDVFVSGALNNTAVVCRRFEWLWERVLRMRLMQQSYEPTEEQTILAIDLYKR
jgi:hypothetical protein